MWTTRAKSILSAALVGAAWLAAAGSAQAAVYTGRYDPAYGGPFPQLGWGATAVFDVPGDCLLSDGPHTVSGVCAGFTVLSAKVDLYNIAAPAAILGSFDLDPGVFVTGITIGGGALTGVNTQFFTSFVPTLDIAGGGDYAFHLELFGNTLAQLIYAKPTTASPGCDQFHPDDGSECGHSANPAVGHFTLAPIPEPETYALMLAGLGALGFLARRRRA